MAVFSPAFSPAARPFVRPAARPSLRLPATERLLEGPVLLGTGLLAAFLLTLLASVVAGPAGARPAGPAVHNGPVMAESAAYPAWTIRGGDTLWTIAERVAPSADPRAVVLQLQVLNGLAPDVDLQPGQVLQLPVAPAR